MEKKNKTTLLIKLAAKREEALNLAMKKIAEMENDIKEIAEEYSSLKDKNEELEKEKAELIEKVKDVTGNVAEKVTNPVTTEAISEEKKDALVDSVAKVDPELAGELRDAIDEAENKEELTGEKLASIISGVFLSLANKPKIASMGSSFSSASIKSAGRGSNSPIEQKMLNTLDRILK